MAARYALEVIHNGTNSGDICIFQTYDGQMDNLWPLAWYSKKATPGANLTFEWNTDLSIVWDDLGHLVPGMVFKPCQIMDANPSDTTKNTLLLTRENGSFCFSRSNNATSIGSLGVICDHMIPSSQISVGVAMSGKPTHVMVASPGQKCTFQPHPRYWVAFGRFTEGEVLDFHSIPQKFEISFPLNSNRQTVVLTPDNTWIKK